MSLSVLQFEFRRTVHAQLLLALIVVIPHQAMSDLTLRCAKLPRPKGFLGLEA